VSQDELDDTLDSGMGLTVPGGHSSALHQGGELVHELLTAAAFGEF
jgi:hypothetical protein